MKIRIRESDKKGLLAAFLIMGIGLAAAIIIVVAVGRYRANTYTVEVKPSEYKIISIKEYESTGYSSSDGSVNTEPVYVITVEYTVDGVTCTDTVQMLKGTGLELGLYQRYQDNDSPEEALGSIFYSPEDPYHIGIYGEEGIFTE